MLRMPGGKFRQHGRFLSNISLALSPRPSLHRRLTRISSQNVLQHLGACKRTLSYPITLHATVNLCHAASSLASRVRKTPYCTVLDSPYLPPILRFSTDNLKALSWGRKTSDEYACSGGTLSLLQHTEGQGVCPSSYSRLLLIARPSIYGGRRNSHSHSPGL